MAVFEWDIWDTGLRLIPWTSDVAPELPTRHVMTGYLEGMVSVAVIEDGDASDTVTQKMMKMARVMDKAGICI